MGKHNHRGRASGALIPARSFRPLSLVDVPFDWEKIQAIASRSSSATQKTISDLSDVLKATNLTLQEQIDLSASSATRKLLSDYKQFINRAFRFYFATHPIRQKWLEDAYPVAEFDRSIKQHNVLFTTLLGLTHRFKHLLSNSHPEAIHVWICGQAIAEFFELLPRFRFLIGETIAESDYQNGFMALTELYKLYAPHSELSESIPFEQAHTNFNESQLAFIRLCGEPSLGNYRDMVYSIMLNRYLTLKMPTGEWKNVRENALRDRAMLAEKGLTQAMFVPVAERHFLDHARPDATPMTIQTLVTQTLHLLFPAVLHRPDLTPAASVRAYLRSGYRVWSSKESLQLLVGLARALCEYSSVSRRALPAQFRRLPEVIALALPDTEALDRLKNAYHAHLALVGRLDGPVLRELALPAAQYAIQRKYALMSAPERARSILALPVDQAEKSRLFQITNVDEQTAGILVHVMESEISALSLAECLLLATDVLRKSPDSVLYWNCITSEELKAFLVVNHPESSDEFNEMTKEAMQDYFIQQYHKMIDALNGVDSDRACIEFRDLDLAAYIGPESHADLEERALPMQRAMAEYNDAEARAIAASADLAAQEEREQKAREEEIEEARRAASSSSTVADSGDDDTENESSGDDSKVPESVDLTLVAQEVLLSLFGLRAGAVKLAAEEVPPRDDSSPIECLYWEVLKGRAILVEAPGVSRESLYESVATDLSHLVNHFSKVVSREGIRGDITCIQKHVEILKSRFDELEPVVQASMNPKFRQAFYEIVCQFYQSYKEVVSRQFGPKYNKYGKILSGVPEVYWPATRQISKERRHYVFNSSGGALRSDSLGLSSQYTAAASKVAYESALEEAAHVKQEGDHFKAHVLPGLIARGCLAKKGSGPSLARRNYEWARWAEAELREMKADYDGVASMLPS